MNKVTRVSTKGQLKTKNLYTEVCIYLLDLGVGQHEIQKNIFIDRTVDDSSFGYWLWNC